MHTGIKAITAVFCLMCGEIAIRAVICIAQPAEHSDEPTRPGHLDFSSQYATAEEASEAEAAQDDRPKTWQGVGLLCQSLFCTATIIINNVFWVRRRAFSAKWHTIHYFIASGVLLLFLPSKLWQPAISHAKFLYSAMNVVLYQLALGYHASLTATHRTVVMLATVAYLDAQIKNWFSAALEPVDVWDDCLHTALPVILMIVLIYPSFVANRAKDREMVDWDADLEKVLGSLSQGVALTIDF